jgi:predicted lipoprotein with Yx(FWY)xxD motif
VIRAGIALLIAGLAAGCGEDEVLAPTSTPTPPTASPMSPAPIEPTASTTARTGTVVITAESEYGRMLYDASGQPIYLFDAETGSTPRCGGACAADWPPVLTEGPPQARRGAREALLGTTRRKDGSTQVTYAGHPLYFYAHEGKYQVLCHDVVEYGGTWLVVRPDGRPAPG